MSKNLKATESTATATEIVEPTYAEIVGYVSAFIAADKAIEDAERSMSDALTHAPDVARRLASAPRGAARRMAEDVVLGVAKSEKSEPARIAAAKSQKKAIDTAAVAVSRLSLYGRIALAHPALDLSAIRKACNAAMKRGLTAEAIVAAATGSTAAKAIAAIEALKVTAKREAHHNEPAAPESNDESDESDESDDDAAPAAPTFHSYTLAASPILAAALKVKDTASDADLDQHARMLSASLKAIVAEIEARKVAKVA